MPLISDDKAKVKINNPKNIAVLTEEEIEKLAEIDKTKVVPINRGGSHEGQQNSIPMGMNELVGVLAHSDTGPRIAEQFGIDKKHVNDLKQGKIQHGVINPDLLAKVEERTGVVNNLTLDLLTESLLAVKIDLPSIKDLKLREKLSIAKDLSSIVGAIKPQDRGNTGATANIVLFAPTRKNLEDLIEDPSKIINVTPKQMSR